MISKIVYDDSLFLSLPYTAQALYSQLLLNADDEGFVGNTKRVLRNVGLTKKILNILVARKFVIYFEHSDVALITHFFLCNKVPRPKPTTFREEKTAVVLYNNQYHTKEDLASQSQAPFVAS